MTSTARRSTLINRIGLLSGPIAATAMLAIGAPDVLTTDQLISPAWLTLALLLWMAIWWITEAIPIPVTSLLPLIVLPVFGVAPLKEIASAYMHPVIVLLMGGFIFAKAIERWNLHERIALNVVKRFGTSPNALIAGFITASALLSMWISNSATSIMMMPIAISLASHLFDAEHTGRAPFTAAVLLGIAYGCSIGGLGTPIGTPTNLIVIGYLSEMGGIQIDFAQWMLIGIPTVAVMLPIAWFVLTKLAFRLKASDLEASGDVIAARLAQLGALRTPEKRTIATFAVIALLWVSGPIYREWSVVLMGQTVQPLSGLSDHIIAILAVILCFVIPAGSETDREVDKKLLDWHTAESIPWGALLLFGGGLSMAGAIGSTGLGDYFGNSLSVLADLPPLLLLMIVVTLVLFLTEITSNVATASIVAPILGAMALSAGIPLETILVPIALAATCAFMLPMATGPNAVVFSSGHLTMGTMMHAGLIANSLAVVALTLIGFFLAPLVL